MKPSSLKKILHQIQAQESKRITQLTQWCEINSGSNHIEGLDAMRHLLGETFAPIADETHTLEFPPIAKLSLTGQSLSQPVGKALWFRKRPELPRRVLLCGHMDTVYPSTSDFQHIKKLSNQQFNGPGVADMKGGILIMLSALEAFEQCPEASALGWDVFINADEEIGSLASSIQLSTLSQQVQAGLVFEPALDDSGTLARARKGSGHFVLLAKGLAAHTGRDFQQGRNAITLLARAITALDQLNQARPGVTLNVGVIEGGEALNQVPAIAGAKIEVRFSEVADGDWLLEQMQKICLTLKADGSELILQGAFHRPPKIITQATERLFKQAQKLAKTLHFTLDWQDTGGCCDGNNLAQGGLAVLDTLGARGGKIHSPDEYICLESLTERAQLTTCLLQHLALGGLEELYG